MEVSGYMADLHRAIYGSSPQQPFAGFDRPMVMPLGSTEEEYRENLPGVADLAMKYGLPVSPRLHVDISGNKPGT